MNPGVPAFLPPLPPGAPANRLALAKWLVDPKNPLTARVAVNRYWQDCFGVGIVKTAEDFGSQGEQPSHPQLLDWLATEFVANGWDIKAMMRLIVTSATYRQSSRETKEMADRDPENRLLARGPRFRLPAEMVRDNALDVSRSARHPHRWPQRLSLSTQGPVGRNGIRQRFYRADLYAIYRRRSLPAQHVYGMEADGAAPLADDL